MLTQSRKGYQKHFFRLEWPKLENKKNTNNYFLYLTSSQHNTQNTLFYYKIGDDEDDVNIYDDDKNFYIPNFVTYMLLLSLLLYGLTHFNYIYGHFHYHHKEKKKNFQLCKRIPFFTVRIKCPVLLFVYVC